MDYSIVLSFMRNKDETCFRRKGWHGIYIQLHPRTDKILLFKIVKGIGGVPSCEYRPDSEDSLKMDWVVTSEKEMMSFEENN